MLDLFNEYVSNNELTDALLIGRNLLNRNPGNLEIFKAYMDLMISLACTLPSREDRKSFISQSNITLAFFEENVELSREIINEIKNYRDKVSNLLANIEIEQEQENSEIVEKISKQNDSILKEIYTIKEKLLLSKERKEFDKELKKLEELDSQIEHDLLTQDQKNYYDSLNKLCTSTISDKMRELDRLDNIIYNKNAIKSYEYALKEFKSNEAQFKNQTQLFSLVSKSLFGFDASKLFNETLIYYNHVYSYIFSKLDDAGKYKLTEYSIECERLLK